MKIFGKTDKGFKRSDNQDRFVLGTLANGVSFGFVCDGMGGALGGGVASEYLSRLLKEYLLTGSENMAMDPEKYVLDAIDIACERIYGKSQCTKQLKGMGTTISGVTVKDGLCTSYNVGDSRVYILRNGILTQVTEDHSVVQQLYNCGAITEEEKENHPQKNLITRAVGVKNTVEVDMAELKLKKGDRILCTTDGLTNYVEKEEIRQILSDSDISQVSRKLINRALSNLAGDNVTVVVMEYLGENVYG
jgi:serine/threonine protein phosphatase PrpC